MKLKSLIFLSVIVFLNAGCKKITEDFPLTSEVRVVNAVVNMAGVKVDPGRSIVLATTGAIGYNGNRAFSLHGSSTVFKIVDAADTTSIIYNNEIDLNSAAYTVFLAGQSPAAEVIIHEETDFPYISPSKIYSSTDSVVNVRFINLSPNSVPLKIKISAASANEADALAYKEITTWRAFKAAPASTTTYSIQIRNASTDALLTTYSFAANSTKRFKNVTLMIRGLMGTTTGINAFGVTEINYF